MIDDCKCDEIMNRCDAKRLTLGIGGLSDIEKIISLISTGDYEISQGGLTTFYYNQSGDYAEETLWALEQIGAVSAADVLRRSNKLFGDSLKSHERFTRLQRLTEETDDLNVLCREYYDSKPAPWDQLCTYICEHEQDLKQSGLLD